MLDLTRTTSALLEALHNPADAAAWTELDSRYRPILTSLARRAGLNDHDAADAAQDALADFFRAYREQRYSRARGRLRQFLIGIARLKIADIRRARARGPAPLDTALPETSTEADWQSAWEVEQRAAILTQALDELRRSDKLAPQTLAAFELVAVQHVPAAQAAVQLGMTTQEVYLAKSRCLERIRTLISRLETAYNDD